MSWRKQAKDNHSQKVYTPAGYPRLTRTSRRLALFGWTQKAAEMWQGLNNRVRREILDLVGLNRTLGEVSLKLVKRKPFDAFAERLNLKNSRGDRIRTYDPLVPNQMR